MNRKPDLHCILGIGSKSCPNVQSCLTGKGDADAAFAEDATYAAVVVDPKERVNLHTPRRVVSYAPEQQVSGVLEKQNLTGYAHAKFAKLVVDC